MRPLFIILAAAFMLHVSLSRLRATDEPLSIVKTAYKEACEKASAENKCLLLVFTGAWDADCARLEQTLADNRTATLLRERTVPVRINVLTEPALTGKHHVRDVPLMVLLKPDGTEIDRWLGYQSAGRFSEELTRSLAGHPTLERLRAEVKPAEPTTRRELGELLINRGSYPDAMTELRRLYEQLEFSNDPKQKRQTRREPRRVISLLGSIREAYAPAETFLTAKREAHATEVEADPTDWKHASLVANLDASLGQPENTLEFFHALPEDSPARAHLKYSVFGILVRKRVYPEAATLFTAADRAHEIEKMAAIDSSPIMQVAYGTIHTMYPLQGGEIIKHLHKNFTNSWAKQFEPFAGIQDRESARSLAESILKYDKSKEGATLLTASAHRALGDQADAFLRSLDLPGLPTPGKPASGHTDNDSTWTPPTDEEDNQVIRLEPFMITARTTGCVPMSLGLPAKSLKIEIKSHVPVHTPSTINMESLAPFRNGALLVAIDGKSIKGKTWKWLGDFWLEGGEAGDQVTLVLKGKGRDDCVYHEVKVKRVRPAKMDK